MDSQTQASRFKIFDAHFHIIDERFPLVANHGFLPREFNVEAYEAEVSNLRVVGGAVVSGSFHAFDQTYLVDALERLGPQFVGVTQLSPSVSDEELIRLDELGVRALRFNIRRGGSAAVADLESMANRVYELVNWHVEIYVDSSNLDALFDTLVALPKVSIDHLGLSKEGFPTVLDLAASGVQIKASGFGRLDFPADEAIREIVSVNPTSLVFGTDLPGTRAPRTFRERDVNLVADTLGESLAQKIYYDNAVEYYRPRQKGLTSEIEG